MDKRVVSIIVPVHNEEKNINRCIESIQNQTYKNIEVIIVDDGSDDASGLICDEYSKIDKRIKVYHIENMGVSNARNYGLMQASGTYVQFVDSDDYIAFNATDRMVSVIEKQQTDLVVCSYIRLFREFRLKLFKIEKMGIYTNVEYLCNTLKDPGHHYYGVIWNKLYKMELIKRFNLLFQEDVRLGEDFIFNLHYLRHIKRISIIQDHLCYYNCENDNSLSRYRKTLLSCKKELEYRNIIFNEYKLTFIESGLFERYKKEIQRYWQMYYIRNIFYINHNFKKWDEGDISEWKHILDRHEDIKECIRYNSRIKRDFLYIWVYTKSKLIFVVKSVLKIKLIGLKII